MSGMPDYSYRPVNKGEPFLRSYSNLRARIFNFGTYFRVREIGPAGNNISIRIVNYNGEAYLVVVNYNIVLSECVRGDATASFLQWNMDGLQRCVITNLDTVPRAGINSISIQIGALPGSPTYEQDVKLGSTIILPERLITTFDTVNTSPGASITIDLRPRSYRLVSFADPLDPAATGWGIDDLRAKINSQDPWIEMPERGADPQDEIAMDNPALAAEIPETFFKGGSGTPAEPSAEETGPTRTLIHINYSEDEIGTLVALNQVLEWAGTSALDGAWRKYKRD